MRSMKKWLAILAVAVLALGLALPAAAADELKLTRAVKINDTQIVLEFSAPVAVNLHEENRGPFMAIRYTDEQQNLQWDGAENQGIPRQFEGSWEFVDETQDKIIWTLNENGLFGFVTIDEIMNFEGEAAPWNWCKVMFCMEEVPYGENVGVGNGKLNNVTTLDGETELSGTRQKPGWWDGLYAEIEVDDDYVLSSGGGQQGTQTPTGSDNPPIAIGETPIASVPESAPASSSASSGADAETMAPAPAADYTVFYIVGGVLVLVIAGLIVYIAASKKKNKPESADKAE